MKFIVLLIFLAVGFLVFWAAKKDAEAWQSYQTQHHCESKGTKQANVSIGFDGKRSVPVLNPEQTIYVCDGGEIVIR